MRKRRIVDLHVCESCGWSALEAFLFGIMLSYSWADLLGGGGSLAFGGYGRSISLGIRCVLVGGGEIGPCGSVGRATR